MIEATIPQSLHGSWIRLVFVAAKDDVPARWDDPAEQLFDLFLGGPRIGASERLLQDRAFQPLCGPHRAAAPELSVVEAVDEVRDSDQEIDVHRPVLAVLEGAEAIKNEGLSRRRSGPHGLVEEEAVSAEAIAEAADGGVGDALFAGDLSQGGAGNETVEDGLEEIPPTEPVVDGEGL